MANKKDFLAKGVQSFVKNEPLIKDAPTSKRSDVQTLDKIKERLGLKIDRDLKKQMKALAYKKFGSSEKVSLVAEEAFFEYIEKNKYLLTN